MTKLQRRSRWEQGARSASLTSPLSHMAALPMTPLLPRSWRSCHATIHTTADAWRMSMAWPSLPSVLRALTVRQRTDHQLVPSICLDELWNMVGPVRVHITVLVSDSSVLVEVLSGRWRTWLRSKSNYPHLLFLLY